MSSNKLWILTWYISTVASGSLVLLFASKCEEHIAQPNSFHLLQAIGNQINSSCGEYLLFVETWVMYQLYSFVWKH